MRSATEGDTRVGMHVDPMAALPATTAADYLAALKGEPELHDNPDARLAFFRRVCVALQQDDSGLGSDMDRACAGSPAALAVWLALLLRGAQDAWSAVRRVCIEALGERLQRAIDMDEGRTRGDPAAGATGVDTAEARPTSAFAMVAGELLTQTRAAWAAAEAWYVREGLLRVCEGLLRAPGRGHSDDGVAAGDDDSPLAVLRPWCGELLRDVAAPSLADPQLPVREHAVAVLCALVDVDRGLAEGVADTVTAELESLYAAAERAEAAATVDAAWSEARTRRAEGHLLAVVRLSTPPAAGPAAGGAIMSAEEGRLYRVLSCFAAHPASSVRQYVAEALGQPSDALYVALLEHLLATADTDTDAGRAVPWQTTETLLMALQQHLVRYLGAGVEAHATGLAAAPAEALLQRVLAVVMNCAASDRFELARMGHQVLPLLLQYWVRHTRAVQRVMTAVCALDPAVDADGLAGALADPVARGRWEVVRIGLVGPALWWYVAIRAATERVGGVGDGGARAALAIPRSVTARWRVWLGGKGGGDDDAATAHFAVRLALASYFTPQAFADDPDFYTWATAPLLEAPVWRAVLAAPGSPAAERLPWGLDFVHAPVCGGAAAAVVQARLVPVWLDALPAMLTHQQCVLLCMVRAVLSASSGGGNGDGDGDGGSSGRARDRDRRASASPSLSGLLPSSVSHRPFSFVFHPGLFGSPATLDGGEDLMLGHTWLRAYFPTEESLAEPAAAPAGDGHDDGAVAVAVAAVLDPCGGFRRLYAPRGAPAVVEPVVRREAQALLIALARLEAHRWAADALAVVVARLDAVLPPRWWVADDEGVTERAAAEPTGGDGGWDDWDDDEDGDGDGDGAVQGIAPDEEIRDAASMARLLHRRAAPTPADRAHGGAADVDEVEAKVAFLLRQ